MKTARIVIILTTTLLVSAGYGQATVRATLQSNYDKISQLSAKKDKVALERLIRKNASSSFEFIDSMRNTLDISATVRQNTEQISKVRKFISNSNKIIGVKANGPDLICTVKTTYDILIGFDGKARVKGTSISQDTWTKTLKGWKIRRSKVIKESAYQNGKLIS
jgi:hypothetical protein